MFFKRFSPTYRFNCCTCIYFYKFVLLIVGVILLELTKYARIGKSPIIKAIGVQKNHTETLFLEHQELDVVASGCFSCPYYKYVEFKEYMPEEVKNICKQKCGNCPKAVYKTVTTTSVRYINEKNRYGYAPRLKAIAIKLLLIYHFCAPDQQGIVKDLSVKQLAALIGCTQRSIKNANTVLAAYRYINLSSFGWKRNTFCIQLTEYKEYGLPANKGGRGYATFNKTCLLELLKIKDINQLRIFLRSALEMDTKRTETSELSVKESYTSLRHYLPLYCKPGVIRRAINQASSLFDVYCTDTDILLKMKACYHGRNQYDKENKQNASLFKELFNKIDNAITLVNDAIMKKAPVPDKQINYLSDLGIRSTVHLRPGNLFVNFKLKERDFQDLAILATSFGGYKQIKKYIGYIYENYTVHFSMDCIGALIRTILKKEQLLSSSNVF